MSEECYSGHAEVPLVNALDECRAERDQLNKIGKLMARALREHQQRGIKRPRTHLVEKTKEALKYARVMGLWKPK